MAGRYRCKTYIPLYLLLFTSSSVASNFPQCLANVMNCATTGQNCLPGISSAEALSFLRMENGSSYTTNSSDVNSTAVAMSYEGCQMACGGTQEPFSWNVFSQEFSAWLLPYLALVSQLPFGARRRTDNLMSAFLTLGSPTLVGYSLYITLLNARWLNDQLFSGIDYPSVTVRRYVVQVLNSLQQVPLRVRPGRPFESLVVHPDNDQWWSTLSEELDYAHTWSIASATSIAWVVIAYLFTVADSFFNVADHINSNGQGTGSVWLWLLPIVIGWLVLSPKCDYYRVQNAYKKANKQIFEPNSEDGGATSVPVMINSGIIIDPNQDCYFVHKDITSPDELRIPPVFNYARMLSWSRTVYIISLFYRAAWSKWNRREGFDGRRVAGHASGSDVPRECRTGNHDQIAGYCRPDDRAYSHAKLLWPRGIRFNMVVASLMSLQLQWATTIAAVLVVLYTPTTGLGCRSLAYLLYGALSTIVWILLVLSSTLGYYASHLTTTDDFVAPTFESSVQYPPSPAPSRVLCRHMSSTPLCDSCVATPFQENISPTITVTVTPVTDTNVDDQVARCRRAKKQSRARILSRAADWLRWIGKSLAIVNGIGIIAISIFQYADVYDTCYCNSSELSRHAAAYFIMNLDSGSDPVKLATSAWIGAVVLALLSCAFFVGTIYLIQDSLPL